MIAAVILVNWQNINKQNLSFVLLLPVILLSGYILSFRYFPNLSLFIKIAFSVGYASIFYLMLLMQNVFLVVDKKGELIPLYRVAVTWSEVLIALLSVPILAGVFKLDTNFFIHGLIAAFLALFFTIYVFWIRHFDPEIKLIRVGDAAVLSLFTAYIVFAYTVSVSFFPTEAFLRALCVSTVLMFGINMVAEYLKNTLTRAFLIRSFLITLLFTFLMIVFHP